MKSPGRKAYERAAEIDPPRTPWLLLENAAKYQWELIAQAVLSPEPNSYAEIGYEAAREVLGSIPWEDLSATNIEACQAFAEAAISEYIKRHIPPAVCSPPSHPTTLGHAWTGSSRTPGSVLVTALASSPILLSSDTCDACGKTDI